MTIFKNNEQIGTFSLVDNDRPTIDCNWNKLTPQEIFALIMLCSDCDLEEVESDKPICNFTGRYPTQEELSKCKEYSKG